MGNRFLDRPVTFACKSEMLHGILSEPDVKFDTAVIIVVGGPQFRVGSHRQFVLLARYLAQHGILALRFDYTGMGYSHGQPKKFFEVDDDIQAAMTFVSKQFPQLTRIYLWGLCDAASAIAFTAYTDDRINGVIISNPWVRSDASHSEAILKNYYRNRIFSWTVWKELITNPAKIIKAIISLLNVSLRVLLNIFGKRNANSGSIKEISQTERQSNLAASVLEGLSRFDGQICLLLSKEDLTANEFLRELENSGWMQNADNSNKITVHNIEGADHTFSTAAWRAQVEKITINFVNA